MSTIEDRVGIWWDDGSTIVAIRHRLLEHIDTKLERRESAAHE